MSECSAITAENQVAAASCFRKTDGLDKREAVAKALYDHHMAVMLSKPGWCKSAWPKLDDAEKHAWFRMADVAIKAGA